MVSMQNGVRGPAESLFVFTVKFAVCQQRVCEKGTRVLPHTNFLAFHPFCVRPFDFRVLKTVGPFI